jgi:hypothetical protein
MSPTPILDRQRVPPAPPPVKTGQSLAIGAAIGLVIVFLPGGVLTGNVSASWVLAGLLPALFCGILAHELGHLTAGLMVGFEFRRILVGPWMLTRESRGWRLRFVPSRILGLSGYTLMTPRSSDDLARRFALFATGGPLVTLLLFVPVALLPWGPVTESLLFANLIMAVFSWLPLEIRGHYTDGKIIQILSRRGPAAERLAAVLYLMALDGRGVPPDQWPQQVVANLSAAGGDRAYRGGGRIYLHVYARATAQSNEVAAALERVLELADELRADLRQMYFAEAAHWQGTANRDAVLARAWLDDARAVKGAVTQKDWDAAALAAIALAEGNGPQFHEHLKRALAYLDRQPGPSGSVTASRARLEALSEMLAV